jgi:predicted peroxiredoxin
LRKFAANKQQNGKDYAKDIRILRVHIIRKYHKNIIDKWVKFFVLKQSVRSTNIKKKL